MNPRTYFRLSLLVPILVPIVAAILGFNELTAVVILSLFFSGIPYLVLAWGLFMLIGRAETISGIRWLSLVAPIVFVLINALFWLVPLFLVAGGDGTAGDGWQFLKILSGYILLLGYTYVLLVNLGFFLLHRRGLLPGAETA